MRPLNMTVTELIERLKQGGIQDERQCNENARSAYQKQRGL